MSPVIPVIEARKNLLNLVDKGDEEYIRRDLTKKGKVKAFLLSPNYVDSLEETVYTLSHSLRDIREAEEELKKAEYITLKEFKKELAKRNVRQELQASQNCK